MTRTRLLIRKEIYHNKPLIEDMWYVCIAYRDAFGNLEFSKSYFESRYDAERFISLKTENKSCYCCYFDGERTWKNIDELLGGE